MAKMNYAAHPELRKAWDAYGHAVKFEELDGIKMRPDGCYCVVRWKNKDGSITTADLYRTRDTPWEFQNDDSGDVTEAEWKKLFIPAECDWFEIPGRHDGAGPG